MRLKTVGTVAAIILALTSTTAGAWHPHQHSEYAWDKGCDDNLCYAPYTAYMNGRYASLRCADPYKVLTYVGNELKCIPRGTAKK